MLSDGTKLIDVIPFFDEIDLLEIRLEVLDKYVDLFIISEFSTSFSGDSKDYNFAANRERFSKFNHKIVYVQKQQIPELDAFQNDHVQKNSISEEIRKYVSENDLVLFGDLDEIPNPETLLKAHGYILEGFPIVHFAQTPYYGYLNMEDKSGRLLSYAGEYPGIRRKKWLGTIATKKEFILSHTMTQLRDPSQKKIGKRIKRGGWHFSYCGGANSDFEQRVTFKIMNNAHQEFNNFEVISRIGERLINREDFLGRRYKNKIGLWRNPKMKPVKFSKSFPSYLRKSSSKYPHLVYDRH
jgi:beta-1,4-mannosyl-glycoprotein beta-1,4-N-acetylglucosaminyltransferase